jgi:hypothetical protein
MYVLDDPKLVYLAQPRCASRAIAHYMKELGARSYGTHHEADLETLTEYRDRGYRVFTVARNHWDMVASWWCINRGKHQTNGVEGFTWDPPWDEFYISWPTDLAIRNHYEKPHRMYWLYQGLADIVIRYEWLQGGLDMLFGYEVELPLMGASTRTPYREQFTAEQRDFIGAWYAKEIQDYDYEF